MLIVQSNGITTEFDVTGEPSPFQATQIPDNIGWWREDQERDGSGRLTQWRDKSLLGNHITAPVANADKPLSTANAVLNVFPELSFDGTSQYLSVPVFGPIFSGSDVPVTFVTVFRFVSVINNRVTYGLSSAGAANPLHEFFLGGGSPAYQFNRRDNAGVQITVLNAVPAPNTSRHVLVDVFAGTTRTTYLDGSTLILAGAQNVGVADFSTWTLGCRFSLGVGSVFSNIAVVESAVYARALTSDQAGLWARYARERYAF